MTNQSEKLSGDIRAALGSLNNDAEPVVALVRQLVGRVEKAEAVPMPRWVKCSERLPELRMMSRKAPNGILVKFNNGRIVHLRDVTETLVSIMKFGPRQPKKFEAPSQPRVVEWLDLDEVGKAGGEK